MRAVVYEKFGPPEVLQITEIEKPSPKQGEVLVKIHASSINFGDRMLVLGKPFLIRLMGYGLLSPKYRILGGDIAGTVEAVGESVSKFKPGDMVYADIGNAGFGGYAEYVSVSEDVLTLKPSNVSFEAAAAVPQAAAVALQGLRDRGEIESGQKVLINGASGAIGTFAVQIAKAYDTEVTGVCSTQNMELVSSIGADHVIDYKKEDFTKGENKYDIILDIVANLSISDYMNALNPNGRYVAVAFNPSALFLGSLYSKNGKKAAALSHTPRVEDLAYLRELIEAGKVKPVVDKIFPLDDIGEAMRYHESGAPNGKVVITMEAE
ncbi:MAG: NAD(P)-dependent alcohol dehydrogenase [Candidatus Bathyarchaeota archaeon]|nr:NAD(P)-dependent alcohol dehydrogenase [Candidatus Bathyarchaeota archaeon]